MNFQAHGKFQMLAADCDFFVMWHNLSTIVYYTMKYAKLSSTIYLHKCFIQCSGMLGTPNVGTIHIWYWQLILWKNKKIVHFFTPSTSKGKQRDTFSSSNHLHDKGMRHVHHFLFSTNLFLYWHFAILVIVHHQWWWSTADWRFLTL